MAIVVERVSLKNNPQPLIDQVQGKDPRANRPPPPPTLAAAAAPQKDINADIINQKNDGFFGSFFKKDKPSRPGIMDQVPSVLKASGTLSEREQIETEVISIF